MQINTKTYIIPDETILNSPSEKEKELLNFLNTYVEKENPKREETLLSPEQIADMLLDYQTGKVKNEKVDLLPQYEQLVTKTRERMQTNPELFPPDKPVIILSDVAKAMINKIAEEGNRRKKEFGMVYQGITIPRNGPENNVYVVAFVTPASDFVNPIGAEVNIAPALHTENAPQLAENTNLTDYFKENTVPHPGNMEGSTYGDNVIVGRIHHEGLGVDWARRFSNGDYNQAKEWLQNYPNQRPFLEAVVSKNSTNGELHMNVIRTYKDVDGNIQHQEHLPILLQEQIDSQSTRPATPDSQVNIVNKRPSDRELSYEQLQNIYELDITDPKNTREAIRKFIEISKDPSNWRNRGTGILESKFGFFRLENQEYLANGGVATAADIYHFPIMIHSANNHARTITKWIYNQKGNWYFNYYDPLSKGIHTSALGFIPSDKQKMRNFLLNIVISQETMKNKIGTDLTSREYDLENILSLLPPAVRNQISESLFQPFQGLLDPLLGKNGRFENCTYYSFFVGAILNALQPGDTEFKRLGLPKIEKDFGIHIPTLEEIQTKYNLPITVH